MGFFTLMMEHSAVDMKMNLTWFRQTLKQRLYSGPADEPGGIYPSPVTSDPLPDVHPNSLLCLKQSSPLLLLHQRCCPWGSCCPHPYLTPITQRWTAIFRHYTGFAVISLPTWDWNSCMSKTLQCSMQGTVSGVLQLLPLLYILFFPLCGLSVHFLIVLCM